MNLLECKNLCKKYDKRYVINSINLEIPKGKIIGLFGKNGAGKSTLFKLINSLVVPTSGEILFNGKKLGVESKKEIAYLPDRSYLTDTQKVDDILEYFNDFYDNFNIKKARKLIKELKINPLSTISKMSKGKEEIFRLILVLSRDASLYILDEPLEGVDAPTKDYIIKTILSNYKEDSTFVISTHLISDIEKILDEVIFLDEGKIVLNTSCDLLRKKENKSIDEIFRGMFK